MAEADSQRVLGVFAKRPLPGSVKTRLAAATSPEFAARVAEAFLRDTLDRLSGVAARRVVAFSPPDSRPYFEKVAGGRFTTEAQAEGDLGARMAHFFGRHLGGAERVVLVGTDSPTLPVEFIEEAFARLKAADLVLGPATDGGYYLIGGRRSLPPSIFDGISWGSHLVLAETVARLPNDCRLDVLPPWYDVDTVRDLEVMAGHLSASRRAGVDLGVKCTGELPEP